MIMRIGKTTSIFALALILGLGYGCDRRESLIFDETPSERVNQTITQLQNVLPTAPNGWELRFYPSEEREYGGFTSFVKFTQDGRVEASSELLEADKVYSGLYEVNASNGPSLVFNTYNKAIHLYSEPNSNISVFKRAHISEGAEGDYSYQIQNVSSDKIILRGAKSRVLLVMTPAKEEDWKTQILQIQHSSSENQVFYSTLSVAGKEIQGVMMSDDRHLDLTLDGKELSVPFRYTQTGIELYEPIEVAGSKISKLDRDPSSTKPRLVSPDQKCTMTAENRPLSHYLSQGLWSFDEKTSTGRTKTAISRVKSIAGHAEATIDITALGIMHQHPLFGGSFGVWGAINAKSVGLGVKIFHIPITLEVISDTEVKFTYDPANNPKDNVNSEMVRLFKLEKLVAPFANIGNRAEQGDQNFDSHIFTLSTDNPYKPTLIRLEDKSIPNNTITLTKGA